MRALACLSRIGDPAQADLFRELVQDPDLETRRLAVEGLGRVADPAELPAFKKDFQRERNDELKLAYSFALTLLGDRAFLDTIVLGLPSRTLGRRARGYLLEIGTPLLPDLYPYLGDPTPTIRAELCDIIGAAGRAGGDRAAHAAAERSQPEGGRPREPGGRAAPARRRERIGADERAAASAGAGRRCWLLAVAIACERLSGARSDPGPAADPPPDRGSAAADRGGATRRGLRAAGRGAGRARRPLLPGRRLGSRRPRRLRFPHPRRPPPLPRGSARRARVQAGGADRRWTSSRRPWRPGRPTARADLGAGRAAGPARAARWHERRGAAQRSTRRGRQAARGRAAAAASRRARLRAPTGSSRRIVPRCAGRPCLEAGGRGPGPLQPARGPPGRRRRRLPGADPAGQGEPGALGALRRLPGRRAQGHGRRPWTSTARP